MSTQAKRAVGSFCSVVAVALIALWPPSALAGQAGHRTRHIGGHQQRLQRHGKPSTGKSGAGRAGSSAPAQSAPTTAR